MSVSNQKVQKAVLKEAELYQQNTGIQKRDAKEAIQEFDDQIQWKERANVLDIGSGDGGVTTSIVKPYLPESFEKIVGCDIVPEMVALANKNYGCDKIQFIVHDITNERAEWENTFDHVFSFYALHWVHDQERAIRNIQSFMTLGGTCLLTLIAKSFIHEIYRDMAKDSKWSQYMYDVEDFISLYQDSKQPKDDLANFLEKCELKNVEVEFKTKIYTFESLDALKGTLRTINPFIHRLTSPEMKDSFMEEYLEIFFRDPNVTRLFRPSGELSSVTFPYSILVAFASK